MDSVSRSPDKRKKEYMRLIEEERYYASKLIRELSDTLEDIKNYGGSEMYCVSITLHKQLSQILADAQMGLEAFRKNYPKCEQWSKK